MSQWLHINGAIQLSYIPIDIIKIDDFEKILGKTCSFYDSPAVWSECNVPCGSEGSMQYRVIENGNIGAHSIDIIFWGDLRDKGEEMGPEIFEYFNSITKNIIIREGFFSINVEGVCFHAFAFIEEEWKKLQIVEKTEKWQTI